VTFHPPTPSKKTSKHLPARSCDFSCHENWKFRDGSVPKVQPCSGDVAIFSDDHAVTIFNKVNIKYH